MRFLILISLLFSLLYSSTAKKITLQLNWLHQFQFAGYYVAKEKGYYKDAGLDVDIKEYRFGLDLTKEIKNQKADFAIGRSSLLIKKSKGEDIVAMFAAFQHSPLMLLVKKNNNIKVLEDLKNKKIMITEEAIETASIIAMLNSRNIDLSDLKVLEHSFRLNDLIDGKTDAMASYMSNEPVLLDEKNIPYKVFHPRDYGFDFYSDILYTSSRFIKENPKVTKAFYDATEKGWYDAFDNIYETAKLIYKKYNSQKKSLSCLVSEGEILRTLAYSKGQGTIGAIDKKRLEKIIEVYRVMGFISKDIDLDEFVYKYNSYKMFNLHITPNKLTLFILIVVLSFLLLVAILFFLSIKRKWLLTNEQLEKEIAVKTQNLNEQTYTDFLTKAKNRKAYSEKLEEVLALYQRYGTPFSIILLDIDNFKRINDNYGHIVGDTVLINLVSIVNSTIRTNDFVFRVGGEEFIVIFSNTKMEDAKTVSEHIRRNIEKELSTIKNEVITISIGLYEVCEDDDKKTIYEKVDKLMYTSKQTGKNKISF